MNQQLHGRFKRAGPFSQKNRGRLKALDWLEEEDLLVERKPEPLSLAIFVLKE